MARNKGRMNKTTRMLIDAIILAAEEAGEDITPGHPSGKLVAYLKHSAQTQPAAFMGLLGRILPLQMSDPSEEVKPVVNICFTDGKDEKKDKDVVDRLDAGIVQVGHQSRGGLEWPTIEKSEAVNRPGTH